MLVLVHCALGKGAEAFTGEGRRSVISKVYETTAGDDYSATSYGKHHCNTNQQQPNEVLSKTVCIDRMQPGHITKRK